MPMNQAETNTGTTTTLLADQILNTAFKLSEAGVPEPLLNTEIDALANSIALNAIAGAKQGETIELANFESIEQFKAFIMWTILIYNARQPASAIEVIQAAGAPVQHEKPRSYGDDTVDSPMGRTFTDNAEARGRNR